ncbi:unnamed protein product [Alternaria burnsii]|nr:unnamed protein product [Alternaria burnsii]
MSSAVRLLLLLATSALAFAVESTLPSSITSAGRHLTLANDNHFNGTVKTTGDDSWTLSVARGTKLLQGMKASDAEAAALYTLGASAESAFDGDLINKLREWGYNDATDALAKQADPECNFDSSKGHMLKKAFSDLAISTKPKSQGGPNQCFLIEHYDSPAVKKGDDGKMPLRGDQRYEVCDKEYRVTGAEHTIGVNAEAGVVYAINLSSAAKAARRLWKRAALTDELPAIRSVSDIAWAFWNRVHSDVESLQNIRYLFVTMIINKETNQHITRALGTLNPPKEDVEVWPGHDFDMETDAGKALLGSPVGRWAGYFLMQHKRQLGGSKWISKVRVFKSEKEGSWPYFLFYVDSPPAPGVMVDKSRVAGSYDRPRIVRRSEDGSHVVREHVMRTKISKSTN